MKDELGGKIITEFATLRPKIYSYSNEDGKEDKKAKGIKKCVIIVSSDKITIYPYG